MSYADEEQDAREYAQLQALYNHERMREPTEPYDGGYLLVDDEQVQEAIGFRSIDGAVEYASSLEHDHYTIYQLQKVLWIKKLND